MFLWKSKKIAMKHVNDQIEASKLEGQSFLSICNYGKFLPAKETEQKFAMVKKKSNPTGRLEANLQPLEYKKINVENVPYGLS